jgi:hypothetical protein
VRYYRLGQLLDELNIGHADGSYRQQLAQLAKKKGYPEFLVDKMPKM